MAVTRKIPIRTGEFDLDEEEDKVEVFQKGEIGRIIKPSLLELVSHHREGVDRERIESFVKWVPEQTLEEFIVLALEYATDKAMPKPKHPTRRARPARA